jgi:chromosome segregation ATPase
MKINSDHEKQLLRSEVDRLSRDLAAARKDVDDYYAEVRHYRKLSDRQEEDLAAARRENTELRERVIEEIAQFVENEPIHSWVPGILAKRIRALSAQPDPHKSMTETLMDPDEKKFWDAADRQDDEQDTGSGK